MLSALLGAICAVSMACAPALVQPSSNLSNNDGGISTVHRAYYDADNVAEYGTADEALYTYITGASGEQLWVMIRYGNDDVNVGIGYSEPAGITSDDDGVFELHYEDEELIQTSTFYLYDMDGNNGYYNSPIDLYYSGEFIATINPVGNAYTFPAVEGYGLNGDSVLEYAWLFEHRPYALGTDTVADIAEGLTSGIGTVATGIGGGLQSLMQNIFLVGTVDSETGAFTATGLSTFGIVTVVFCGLALALGLSRWIVNFVGSVGARDR